MSDSHRPETHVPSKHAGHDPARMPCGCWTGPEDGKAIYCSICGAAYQLLEVLSFPAWRCYDCGTRWVRDGRLKVSDVG